MILQKRSRRKFLTAIVPLPAVLSTATIFGNCRSKPDEKANQGQQSLTDCGDLSGVSENDVELRKKFAYVKESPIADNQCNNCNLYLPPKEPSLCGGCMLFRGPVYPSAYCTYWAPKV